MSFSITILPRSYEINKEGTGCSSSSSYSASPRTPQNKGKGPATATPASTGHNRKPSFLSPSFIEAEHTVINMSEEGEPPRLITCVRCSQGYEWNPEIFLPSYMGTDFESFDRKREPVHEITLTDEEAKNLFPQ